MLKDALACWICSCAADAHLAGICGGAVCRALTNIRLALVTCMIHQHRAAVLLNRLQRDILLNIPRLGVEHNGIKQTIQQLDKE